MSTIIKKMQDMLRNRSRESFKVTFTFTSHKHRKQRLLFCSEGRKNIPQVNYRKQLATRSNVGAYSQKYSG